MRSYRLASADAITGLHDERALVRLLRVKVRESLAGGAPVSLLLLEIDAREPARDRFGRLARNDVLRKVAQLVVFGLRIGDLAARVEGVRLGVVLPGARVEDAARVAERVRERIAAHPVDLPPGGRLPLAAFVGVAGAPEHGASARDLLAAADAALYEARYAGHGPVRSARRRAA